MISSKREAVIQDILDRHGVITVEEICTYCGCSPETSRRDLRRLEREGTVVRTHGGARRSSTRSSAVQPDLESLIRARVALLERIHVLIVTASETAASHFIVDRARRAGVPVIAEGRHSPAATTVVMIDSYRAAYELGRWVRLYAQRNLGGRVMALDVGYGGSSTEIRSQGFADGLGELRDSGSIWHVDGQGTRAIARHRAADAFAVHPDINVIYGINDESVLGAWAAFRAAGLDENRLLVVTFGLEGDGMRNLLLQGGPLKAGVALFPELVSRACVDAAVCAFHGMPLAPRINPPAMILTAETLQDYYEFREDTGRWQIRLEQAGNIPNLSAPYVLLHECRCKTGPGRIGYVLNFSSHEYYQNMLQTMRSYTRQKGIALEIVDASQDAARERDEVFRSIGAAAARLVNEGDTIILDAGDAVRWLARALRERKGIRVITNSLSVIQELADRPDITLISCGGVLHHEGKSFIGLQAEAAIRALRADRAFIGAAGVSVDFGLSNSNIDEAAVQQAMLKAAREVILLADPSQIGDESLVQIGSLQAVHCLITGPGIAERDRQNLLSRGVQVMVAEEPPPP